MRSALERDTKPYEIALLYLIWSDDAPREKIAMVKDEWFRSYRPIIKKTRELIENGKNIDLLMAHDFLDPEEFDLVANGAIDPIPVSAHYQHYANVLSDMWAHWAIESLSLEMAKNPSQEIIESMRAILLESLPVELYARSYKDIVSDVVHDLLNPDGKEGIKSGFPSLDNAITGFRPGELYTFGARPGEGKTAMLCRIALTASSNGAKVLYLATEMKDKDIVSGRLLPMHTKIPTINFRVPGKIKPFIPHLQSYLDSISKRKIFIFDSPTPSLSDTMTLVAKVKPNILMVDYLQRCNPPKAESRRLEIAKLVIGFKTIARQFNIPVLLAAQLNRSVDKSSDTPKMADLLESSAIEAESDVVVLFWEKKITQKDGQLSIDPKYRLIRAYTAKNRHGQAQVFNMLLDRETTNIFQEGCDGDNAEKVQESELKI